MLLRHVRTAVAPCVIAFFAAASAARAQDPFEIEVYGHQTEAKGEMDLETHLNWVASGTRQADGTVAATHNQAHVAFELTGGLTRHWEVTAYALAAYRPGAGFEYAGWRMRTRVAAPEHWNLPVDLGFAAELEFTRPAYDENASALELRPIVEKRIGRLGLTFNPVIERGLRAQGGGAGGEWELEPSARIGFAVGPRADISLEYYGKAPMPGEVLPADERVAQFFPGLDLRLSEDVEVNVGVGFGATSAGNQLIVKGRVGIPLLEPRAR